MDSDTDPGHGMKLLDCEYNINFTFNITGQIHPYEDNDSVDFTTDEIREKMLEFITDMKDNDLVNIFECTGICEA